MAKYAQQRTLQVYAHWIGLEQPMLMGLLHSTQLRGKEIFSFEYNDKWLKSGVVQNLVPDLQLYQGPQYLSEGKANFGIFLDSSPDRWGRTLMERREAAFARKEKRKSKTLFETDYLLGVYDGDLEELWRRIPFFICVKNTDDHLHNHGFILTKNGWVLSPAFDINPTENGTGLSLNISEKDNALDLDLALEVAPYFRVSEKRAIEMIKTVKKSVQHWRVVAEKLGISKNERDRMQNAFE